MEFKGKKKISVLKLTGLFIGDSELHIFALAYQMEKALLATHQKYIGGKALASVCNRFLLGNRLPSRQQMLLRDRVMVPLSRLVDPYLLTDWESHSLGFSRRSEFKNSQVSACLAYVGAKTERWPWGSHFRSW
jgi:hypothetical protein